MKGEIAYGYKVEPRRGNEIVRRQIGNVKTNRREKLCIFWGVVRGTVPLKLGSEDMHLESRRDTMERDEESLLGYFIKLATVRSRVLPSRKRIERLKRILKTDAEPEWCEIF